MPERGNPDIRAFEDAQLVAVHALAMKTIEHSYAPAYPAEAVAFFKKYHAQNAIRADAERGYTCVAFIGKRLVGTGTLVGDYAKRVFVDPQRQGQGLGKRIMVHLEDKAREQVLPVIRLDASLPSKSFYDALGYSTVQETFVPLPNEERLDYYEMRKTLRESGEMP